MPKLAKDSGRYYLIMGNGTYEDVTDQIEKEVKSRVDLEKKLFEYNSEIDSQIHFRLARTMSRLTAIQKLLEEVLEKSQAVIDAWAKTGNPHGQVISLKHQVLLTQKWLEDMKKEDQTK